MQTLWGIVAVVFSGVLNGSFVAPMKRNTLWAWENTWIIYAGSSMIILPLLTVMIACPQLFSAYRTVSPAILCQTFIFGAGWGIGSLTFGLGLYWVGFSIGYTVIIGIIAVTGALVPLVVHQPHLLIQPSGLLILAAMVVTIVGVFFCGQAGQLRILNSADSITPQRSFSVGLLICIISGILSSMLNLAFDFGAPIADSARELLGNHASSFTVSLAVWLVALSGGFIPNLLYCSICLCRRNSWNKFLLPAVTGHWLRASLMGTLWFACIIFYGIGATQLGKLGTTVGWLILMSVTVIVGNLWGVATNEWKNAPPQALRKMIIGTGFLLSSVILVSFGK